MGTLMRGAAALLAGLVLLAACAPGGGTKATEPQLSNGSRCLTSSDPARCRTDHDRAGIHLQRVHPGGR